VNPNAREHIEKILTHMTQLPGVYKMLGKDGELLYVGKAKNLKNRVSSYFVKTIDHPKTQALVARIYDIESLVVRSETEALLLEQNLIKLHRPPYNIMLRDDKSYVYIFVSADKPYPRIASGRGKGKHQVGKFFGLIPVLIVLEIRYLYYKNYLMSANVKTVIFHNVNALVYSIRLNVVQRLVSV
jgi:excinuclease ABC subunit C